ncbi:MAG: YraN family protein [Elusimicrobiota bacterium]
MTHQSQGELGKSGEFQAEQFLKNAGYKIITKNFRTRYGELDIIARDDDTIVFIEVKTRKGSDKYGAPEYSVTGYKQRNLAYAAIIYIKKNSLTTNYRFDVVAICENKIEHIKNAFVPSGFTI